MCRSKTKMAVITLRIIQISIRKMFWNLQNVHKNKIKTPKIFRKDIFEEDR